LISKEIENHVVVINCIPLKRNLYKVKFAEADGIIHEQKVHEETILDYQLVIGKELDQETFERLQNSNDYQKAYSYAINVLSRRLYSEKQIRRKLIKREFDETTIDDVIVKLTDIKLLDDFVFATAYIEHQLEMGKKSRRQIISDLWNRGVAETIINELRDLFNQESEQVLIIREIEKSYQRYLRKELTDFELRNKVITALCRKGFVHREVKRAYGYFIEEEVSRD